MPRPVTLVERHPLVTRDLSGRCRDESEVGFERYCAFAVLGRNIHALDKLLIAKEDESAPAAISKRAAV